jgi:ribosomal protein S18 acetylase RimI-like enzyme
VSVADMELGYASGDDVEAIAVLHAESWRRHYRGAYLDSYLDGDVLSDRREVWGERLGAAFSERRTIVARRNGEVVGFSHLIFDSDPRFGALLDNLHVTFALKGQHLGSQLLGKTASVLGEARPGSALYLWVLEQNVAAQAFYRARGGTFVEQQVRGPFPGGGTAMAWRVAWPDPSVLTDGVDRRQATS